MNCSRLCLRFGLGLNLVLGMRCWSAVVLNKLAIVGREEARLAISVRTGPPSYNEA